MSIRQLAFNIRNKLLGIDYLDHLMARRLHELEFSLRDNAGQSNAQRQATTGTRYCPVCQNSCSEFASFRATKIIPNIKCPRCGSLARHRLVWLFLKNETTLFSAKLRLLHFAPEPSLSARLRRLSNLEYLTADLFNPRADRALDIQNIAMPDGSFDAVYCSHVLEHVPDDLKAMRELRRILRPGAWALIMVPINPSFSKTYEDPAISTPEERMKHYGQADHLRYYGLDFSERLKNVGFQVRSYQYAKMFDDFHRELYGLRMNDFIFLAEKEIA